MAIIWGIKEKKVMAQPQQYRFISEQAWEGLLCMRNHTCYSSTEYKVFMGS